jgi:hypothetical protein
LEIRAADATRPAKAIEMPFMKVRPGPTSLLAVTTDYPQDNAVLEYIVDHLNSGYLQLGLFALVFGGLQVWWISSTIRKRDLAGPMSEWEFRRSLVRIWAKRN